MAGTQKVADARPGSWQSVCAVVLRGSESDDLRGTEKGNSMGKLIHGMAGTKTYASWKSMKRRCYNPNNVGFKDYGGRGIIVSKRWHKFTNFFEDMGICPTGLTLERINNQKGYSKRNCKWATHLEQNLNTRRSRLLTFKGKTKPLSIWSSELKIGYGTVLHRKQIGWSDEKALSVKVGFRERLVTINGETMNLTKWASAKGINSSIVIERIASGWSPEDAINTPFLRTKRALLYGLSINVVDEHTVGVAEWVGVMV